MTTKHDDLKPIGHSKSSPKRGVYINPVSPQEARESNLASYLMTLEKERKKTQS